MAARRVFFCQFDYVLVRKGGDKPIYLIILFNYSISLGTTHVFRVHINPHM